MNGARRLPLRHVTIRILWQDRGWSPKDDEIGIAGRLKIGWMRSERCLGDGLCGIGGATHNDHG